jgi:hypothetical protein
MNCANRGPIMEQWRDEYRPDARRYASSLGKRKLRFGGLKIMDMNRLPVEHGTADSRAATEFVTLLLKLLHGKRSEVRSDPTDIAVNPPHNCINGVAELRGILGYGVHHRLQACPAAGDHL